MMVFLTLSIQTMFKFITCQWMLGPMPVLISTAGLTDLSGTRKGRREYLWSQPEN